MNNYEILYIMPASLEDATREACIEKYTNLVTESGAEVVSVNKWGVKKFAYPINFKNEGYYVLMTFKSNSELPLEFTRRMNIDENIVRNMISKK